MIPKCSNLALGMTLGYPTDGIRFWVERSKVKVRLRDRDKVNSITVWFELHECLIGHL